MDRTPQKNLSEDVNAQSEKEVDTNTSNDLIDNDTDDEWCETTERSSGVMDTLLQEPDITQDGDRIISFAPGEGNRPLGIFTDKDSEFLSFPTIYCGKRQPDNSEDLCLFTIAQCVNGNSEAKIEESHSLCQTLLTN